jgi:hypothetical protein
MLPCFLAKKIKGKKLLVNYSQYNVVVSNEYLRIVQQKAMEKESNRPN